MKKAVFVNNYLIYSKDINILIELLKNNDTINWYNFTSGDFFYSNENIEYIIKEINHEEKTVVLVEE